jgi:hypothetical protein
MRAGVGLLLLTPLVCAPAAARAADATTVVAGVRIESPSCPIAPLSLSEFVDALRVELAGRALTAAASVVTLAIAPCDPTTQRIEVRVTTEGGRIIAREVGLEDVVPAARPRTLALAVAELVRANATPPPATPPRTVAAEPARASPTSTLAAAGPAAATEAVASVFPSRKTTLWGARAGFAWNAEGWQAGVFAEVAAGARGYAEGDVSVRSIGGGVVAGVRRSSGRWTFVPGIVGTVGWTRVDGRATVPAILAGGGTSLTAALRARIAVSARTARHVGIGGFVEGGVVLRSFDATVDGARATGVGGASVVAGLGVDVGP